MPIITTLMAWSLVHKLPPERRRNFWSYRWSNYVILFPMTAALICVVLVKATGI